MDHISSWNLKEAKFELCIQNVRKAPIRSCQLNLTVTTLRHIQPLEIDHSSSSFG